MIRQVATDADLEAWRRIHASVFPDERTQTIDELRARDRPERRLFLGGSTGAGLADRSGLEGHGTVVPMVLPTARRNGLGTELLRACVGQIATLGIERLVAHVDGRDEGSLAFALRFGFGEADRQVEQVIEPGDVVPASLPDGVEAVTISDRPQLLERAYGLAVEAFSDFATHAAATTTLDEWLNEEATLPAGSFVALFDGEIVGYSGLMADPEDASKAEDGLTAVRRDWRRRGLARALKQRKLAWAAANGIREIVTWTQQGNDGMRALNEELGYEYRHVSLTMTAPRATVEELLR